MKKIMFLAFTLLMLSFGFSSCDPTKPVGPVEPVTPSVQSSELVFENVISTDREDMFLNYDENYRWFESCVLMDEFIDDEDFDGSIKGISSIFQIIETEDSVCYDTKVVMMTTTRTNRDVQVKDAFWVGDLILDNQPIKLTYMDAVKRMQESNYAKPHSRHCVLRRELGPIVVNPQYIFGNVHAQIYVDAVTGEVTDVDPAFPKELNMPLGEWP